MGKVPPVVCRGAVAKGLGFFSTGRGETKYLCGVKSLEVLIVKVDGAKRNRKARLVAFDEAWEFMLRNIFATKEGGTNEEQAKIAFFQCILDFRMPLFANENIRISPALKVVFTASSELFLKL